MEKRIAAVRPSTSTARLDELACRRAGDRHARRYAGALTPPRSTGGRHCRARALAHVRLGRPRLQRHRPDRLQPPRARFPRGAKHHAGRRLRPHQQQWLADQRERAAVHAELRSQQGDRAQGREARARFPAVDDQAARVRRQDRVLGIWPGELHADGGARRGHREDQDLRDLPDAGHPARLCRADVQHDRFDQPWPLRAEPDHRLAAARIYARWGCGRATSISATATRCSTNMPTSCANCGRPGGPTSRANITRWTIACVRPEARRRHEDHLRRLVRRRASPSRRNGRTMPSASARASTRPPPLPSTTSGWPPPPRRPGATSRCSCWS